MFPLQRRRRSETGSSATEYALIMVLIAVVIVTAVTFLGTTTVAMFHDTCEAVPDYTVGATC